jgi:hypothetical protein
MKKYIVVQVLKEGYKEEYKTTSKIVADHQLLKFRKVYPYKTFKIIVFS